jgi:hypothetical protein
MLKNILLSKKFAISLLIICTIFDVGTTYATVKDKLFLDGNPLIRGLNWNQAIFLQVCASIIAITLFLISYRKNENIHRSIHMKFIPFLLMCIKKQFSISFKTFKNDMVYTGLALLWVLVCAHFIAGLLAAFPLLGGPSILSILSRIGFDNFRNAQIIIVIMLIIISIIIGHYPVYLLYTRSFKKAR